MSVPFALKTVDAAQLAELRPFLDRVATEVETASYIDKDPVAFMHAYADKADREIAGFFAALLAWGRRDIVMAKVENLLARMGHRPAELVANYSPSDARRFDGFVHRTWNAEDIDGICRILHAIYRENGGFEAFWASVLAESTENGVNLMERFHRRFFDILPDTPPRTRRHIGDAARGSSCKRLWLYLRWCLRRDSAVDLGIMDFMPVSALMVPLDVHVARYARMLGLLGRPSNDWKAVVELTGRLRELDPTDPGKYDFALFGLRALAIPVPEGLALNPLSAP